MTVSLKPNKFQALDAKGTSKMEEAFSRAGKKRPAPLSADGDRHPLLNSAPKKGSRQSQRALRVGPRRARTSPLLVRAPKKPAVTYRLNDRRRLSPCRHHGAEDDSTTDTNPSVDGRGSVKLPLGAGWR